LSVVKESKTDWDKREKLISKIFASVNFLSPSERIKFLMELSSNKSELVNTIFTPPDNRLNFKKYTTLMETEITEIFKKFRCACGYYLHDRIEDYVIRLMNVEGQYIELNYQNFFKGMLALMEPPSYGVQEGNFITHCDWLLRGSSAGTVNWDLGR
jgi:hypothetical protein